MNYLSLAIVPFMVGLLTPLIFSLIRKVNLKKETKMNKQDFVIYYPLAWAWLSLFTSIALATILILLNIFYKVRLVVNVIVSPFIIFFIFGAYVYIKEKIVINKNTITVTPVFGKTKTYAFSEIERLKEVTWSNGTLSYKVCKKKKYFRFLTLCSDIIYLWRELWMRK